VCGEFLRPADATQELVSKKSVKKNYNQNL